MACTCTGFRGVQVNRGCGRALFNCTSFVRPIICVQSAQKDRGTDVIPTGLVDISASRSSQLASASRRDMLLLSSSLALVAVSSDAKAVQVDMDYAHTVAKRIEKDFVEGQYYVTGRLSPELYNPKCRFLDPTTDVRGVEPYTKAVAMLFDQDKSRADLISVNVVSPTSVVLRWRLEGTLSLPVGKLSIKPYTGTTTYTINAETGLIDSHIETWDISTADAFLSVVFPNLGAPPAPPVEVLRAQS